MPDIDTYEALAKWLMGSWYGLPQSKEVLPLLKNTYTPEEARLLTGIPFSLQNISDIAVLKKMPEVELEKKLKKLAEKGLIFRVKKPESVFYRLSDPIFVFLRSSFWPGKEDERSKKMAGGVNRYFLDTFMEHYRGIHARGLRAVPAMGTIIEPHTVMSYDDVVKLLDELEYFSVSYCACRHRKNLDDSSPDCKYEIENCLHFDELGRYTVENGLGREITKEETLKILREAAEAGLVHGASSWRDKIDTICNCCKCCCMWLEGYHVLKHDMAQSPSSYRARTDAETCAGCGLCVKRCPMEILELRESPGAKNKTGKVSVLVNPEACLGCGVCNYKCPKKSIMLEKKEGYPEPPRDVREHMRKYYNERGGKGNLGVK